VIVLDIHLATTPSQQGSCMWQYCRERQRSKLLLHVINHSKLSPNILIKTFFHILDRKKKGWLTDTVAPKHIMIMIMIWKALKDTNVRMKNILMVSLLKLGLRLQKTNPLNQGLKVDDCLCNITSTDMAK
jgi:hypothetical protein